MPLPDLLAKPIFHTIYWINRRMEGAQTPPIRRVVGLVQEEKRLAFDHPFDSALQSGPNTLIDYNLPDPKIDFLNTFATGADLSRMALLCTTWTHSSRFAKAVRRVSSAIGDRSSPHPMPCGQCGLPYSIKTNSTGHTTGASAWGSTNPIVPLARIKVTPADFPYLDYVQFIL